MNGTAGMYHVYGMKKLLCDGPGGIAGICGLSGTFLVLVVFMDIVVEKKHDIMVLMV